MQNKSTFCQGWLEKPPDLRGSKSGVLVAEVPSEMLASGGRSRGVFTGPVAAGHKASKPNSMVLPLVP